MEIKNPDRFWRQVDINPHHCWEWQGYVMPRGDYGRYGGHLAHRLAYLLTNGDAPKVVRHKCDNGLCVNPEHLEAGTQADNVRDMMERGRHVSANARKTHCPHGHEYTEANTYRIPSNGKRICKTCHHYRM